jgi:hypothetical protein
MPETVEHRILRSRKAATAKKGLPEPEAGSELEDQRYGGKSAAMSPLQRVGIKTSPTSPKVSLIDSVVIRWCCFNLKGYVVSNETGRWT